MAIRYSDQSIALFRCDHTFVSVLRYEPFKCYSVHISAVDAFPNWINEYHSVKGCSSIESPLIVALYSTTGPPFSCRFNCTTKAVVQIVFGSSKTNWNPTMKIWRITLISPMCPLGKLLRWAISATISPKIARWLNFSEAFKRRRSLLHLSTWSDWVQGQQNPVLHPRPIGSGSWCPDGVSGMSNAVWSNDIRWGGENGYNITIKFKLIVSFQCIKKVGVTKEVTTDCESSDRGTELQLNAEQLTKTVRPRFVPTIVYNWVRGFQSPEMITTNTNSTCRHSNKIFRTDLWGTLRLWFVSW